MSIIGRCLSSSPRSLIMIREQNVKLYKYVGDSVNVRNFPAGDSWLLGTIVEISGPLSFRVKLEDGRIIR